MPSCRVFVGCQQVVGPLYLTLSVSIGSSGAKITRVADHSHRAVDLYIRGDASR